MTTRWPRASSGCTKPRSPATWGHGKPPPGSRPPPANGPAGTTPRGSCGAPGAARRANTSRPGATAHSARSPPAARAAGPAGHQKEAAMAAAHYPGGLRPHPPGLRPGPRPSSEMPRQVTTGAAAGGYLLAGRVTGTAEPPPRSRAPPASQAMTLRVTLEYARHGRSIGGESPLEEEVVLTPSRRQLRRREAGWEGSPRRIPAPRNTNRV